MPSITLTFISFYPKKKKKLKTKSHHYILQFGLFFRIQFKIFLITSKALNDLLVFGPWTLGANSLSVFKTQTKTQIYFEKLLMMKTL